MYLLMLIFGVALSMGAGRIVYHATIWFLFGKSLGNYLFWPSYLTFGVAVVVVYLPVLMWVRDRLKGTHPRLLFALVGTFLGIVPAFFLQSATDSRLPSQTSTEILLIYGMFGVSGFVFGLFYVALCRFRDKAGK